MFAIDHLHIRAEKKDSQPVINDFRNGSWSVVDSDAWIFVRDIQCSSRDKHTLRQQASAQVNQAIAVAVDGRLEHAANANAVRFNSFVELLTFLISDLLAGKATQRWYWRRWAYLFHEPKSIAVTRLLWEQTEFLPSLVVSLSQQNLLPKTWACLSQGAAATLLQKKQQETGLSVIGDASTIEDAETAHYLATEVSLKRHSKALIIWADILTGLPPFDARVQLAGLVEGIYRCPSLLFKAPRIVVQCFANLIQDANSFAPIPSKKTNSQQPEKAVRHTGNKQNPLTNDSPVAETTPISQTMAEVIKEHKTRVEQPQENKPSVQLRDVTETDIEKNIAKKAPAKTLAVPVNLSNSQSHRIKTFPNRESPIVGDTFRTQCGGFFYLINAFAQHELIAGYADATNSPWYFMYDFVRMFNLSIDKPLERFIAHQCELDGIDALHELSPLTITEKYFLQLSDYYGIDDLWNARLITLPAQVIATPSHIDVFFSPNAIRLAVRLAGLDINPGWVPWLGRVITFHYREYSAGDNKLRENTLPC